MNEARIGDLTIWSTSHATGTVCWWVRRSDSILRGCYDSVETAIAAAHLTDAARAQLADDLDGQPASIEDVEVAATTAEPWPAADTFLKGIRDGLDLDAGVADILDRDD